MWIEFQEFNNATTSEVENFKALVLSIPGVVVPFDSCAKNMHVLSLFVDHI